MEKVRPPVLLVLRGREGGVVRRPPAPPPRRWTALRPPTASCEPVGAVVRAEETGVERLREKAEARLGAKGEEVERAEVEVRKPAETRAEMSGGVRSVMLSGRVVLAGWADRRVRYFSLSGARRELEWTREVRAEVRMRPSPRGAWPLPRPGTEMRRRTPVEMSLATSRSVAVGDMLMAWRCARETIGARFLRKLRTSAMRVEFMPAERSGTSSNMVPWMYFMRDSTSCGWPGRVRVVTIPPCRSGSSSSLSCWTLIFFATGSEVPGFVRAWLLNEEEDLLRNGFCFGFDCRDLRAPVALNDIRLCCSTKLMLSRPDRLLQVAVDVWLESFLLSKPWQTLVSREQSLTTRRKLVVHIADEQPHRRYQFY